jgi:hypothetical protein
VHETQDKGTVHGTIKGSNSSNDNDNVNVNDDAREGETVNIPSLLNPRASLALDISADDDDDDDDDESVEMIPQR